MPSAAEVTGALDAAYRDERAVILATLARQVGGDIGLAEDAVQDAFLAAVSAWERDGVPDRPGAWLTVAARRRAVDRLRREETRRSKQHLVEAMYRDQEDDVPQPQPAPDGLDDRLRLIFTCCHPAIATEARVALTLKTLCGLEVPEIARAFLTTEPTMYQRLVRTKRKIVAAGIPYEVPPPDRLPERLSSVLRVVYLVFNEGNTPGSGRGLADEAIRLGRLLVELLPGEPEAAGLLSLMLTTHARQAARVDDHGVAVGLDEQDRTRWDAQLTTDGVTVLELAALRARPGPYQVQAAISALHGEAPTFEATDWFQIAELYDVLQAMDPSPVVTIGRAVAVAQLDGPRAGLAVLGPVLGDARMARYQPLHATRAALLDRAGEAADAVAAYDVAIGLTTNAADRAALVARREVAAASCN